jgi:hypothetical protein
VPHEDIEMLEFALPIPSNHREKVRALTYLHETIDYYIKDFCDRDHDIEIPLGGGSARYAQPSINPNAMSVPQAIQIFLTFYICLFI